MSSTKVKTRPEPRIESRAYATKCLVCSFRPPLSSALLLSSGPVTPLLSLLLTHCLAPLALSVREWVLSDHDTDQLCAVQLQPGGSTQADQRPCDLPAFLQPLQHMFQLAGQQMRMLRALQSHIGGCC